GLHHRLEILVLPGVRGDPGEDPAALVGVGDDPGGGREVGTDRAPQGARHARIRLEVVDPGSGAAGAGRATDEQAPVDHVVHDLDAPGLTGSAGGGGDVDDLAGREGGSDRVVHGTSGLRCRVGSCDVN